MVTEEVVRTPISLRCLWAIRAAIAAPACPGAGGACVKPYQFDVGVQLILEGKSGVCRNKGVQFDAASSPHMSNKQRLLLLLTNSRLPVAASDLGPTIPRRFCRSAPPGGNHKRPRDVRARAAGRDHIDDGVVVTTTADASTQCNLVNAPRKSIWYAAAADLQQHSGTT